MEIRSNLKNYQFEDIDFICLKYAYGYACCQSGDKEDLKKAEVLFKEIINCPSDTRFPAAYYGLGLCYYKLNRFKEALSNFKTLLTIIEKGVNYKVYCWPGTFDVIEETKTGRLKEILEDLVKKCECPPPADAICRVENCLFQHPPIYYTDPDFKGFISVHCNEHCVLQYHPSCWKTLRESLTRTDKEFLDCPCLTPDCLGHIIRVETIGKDAVQEKCFQVDDNEKLKRNIKHKKSKLEKKIELREMRKRRRHESAHHSVSDNQDAKSDDETVSECDRENSSPRDETPDSKITENLMFNSKTHNDECDVKKLVSNLSASAKPFYVLKKEDFKEDSKASKSKERKKTEKKKSTVSIDEFCGEIQNFSYYNEYQMRLHRLQESKRVVEEDEKLWSSICESECERIPQLDPSKPFHIPEDLRNDPYALETVLQSYEMPAASKTEKCIKENLYSYLESVLSFKGPLHLNDPELLQEIKNFPPEAQEIIDRNGGFKNFILKSMRFATVDEHVCVLSDVLKAYNLSRPNASGQSYSTHIDSLDDFDVVDENKSSNILTENYLNIRKNVSLHLNPNAAAYNPSKNGEITNINSTNENCVNTFNQNSTISPSNKSLLSVVSELRQPLSAWSSGIENDIMNGDEKENDLLNCYNLSVNTDCFKTTSEEPMNSQNNFNELYSNNIAEISQDSILLEQIITELSPIISKKLSLEETVDTLTKIIKVCFENHLTLEKQSQIICQLKPLAVVRTNKKANKCIQVGTPLEHMVSQGVMKDDCELEQALENVTNLNNEKSSLEKQKKWLEEKLEEAWVKVIKLQNESHAEKNSLEKELEDLNSKYESERKQFKTKQKTFDSEKKNWEQIHSTMIKEEKAHKQEISDLKTVIDSYESQLKDLENKFHENQAHYKTFSETAEKLSKENETLKKQVQLCEKRAKLAEITILNTKKNEFLKKLDADVVNVNNNILEVEDGLNRFANALQPLTVACLKDLISKLTAHNDLLHAIRCNFLLNVEEQIDEVTKGTLLSDLKPLEIPVLPAIPSIANLPRLDIPNSGRSPIQEAIRLQLLQSANPMAVGQTSLNHNIGNFLPSVLPFEQNAYLQNPMVNPYSELFKANSKMFTSKPPGLQKQQSNSIDNTSLLIKNDSILYNTKNQIPDSINKSTENFICPEPNITDLRFKQHTFSENFNNASSSKVKSVSNSNPSDSNTHLLGKKDLQISAKSKSESTSISDNVSEDSYCDSVKSFMSLPTNSSEISEVSKKLYQSSHSLLNSAVRKGIKSEDIDRSDNIELGYTTEKDTSSKVSTPVLTPKSQPCTKERSQANNSIQKHGTKNNYDKLFEKLQIKYPQLSKQELAEYVKLYRQQNNNRLSGLPFDIILAGVGALISKCRYQNKVISRPRSLVNKPLTGETHTVQPVIPTEKPSIAPWAKASGINTTQWSGESTDKSCIICYEEMTQKTSYKVDCGHCFHLECIKEWLNKTSNCPICRVHLLLPEDYPALT